MLTEIVIALMFVGQAIFPPAGSSRIAMAALLTGSGQQLTLCRGVIAVTGDAVEQAG